MLIMAVHRRGPFIWRLQSPQHRQAVLFYYFNINYVSSGHCVIIFPAIRHREAGWRESGLGPVVREEWQPQGRRAPVLGPRPGLRGWAQGHREGASCRRDPAHCPIPHLPPHSALPAGFPQSRAHSRLSVCAGEQSGLVEEGSVLNRQH